MKSFGFTLNLRDDPEVIASYKEYHRRVWPDVEKTLRNLGVRKFRIFLHGRRLFLYMETAQPYDAATFQAEYLKDPKAAEWERLMRERFQEPLPGSKPGEWWCAMEPVYALD